MHDSKFSKKEQYDFMAKTILVGNASVGKTNILLGFTEKYFSLNQNSTIGVDFKLKTMKISGTTLKLQIWDTAGQCRFRNITRTFFQGSSGVMFVYSVDSQSSFSSIPSWVEEANEVSCGTSQVRLLLANKCDLQESRVISNEQGRMMAQQYGLKYMEVSAKENWGLQEAFSFMGEQIIKRKIQPKPYSGKRSTIQPDDYSPKKKRKCC